MTNLSYTKWAYHALEEGFFFFFSHVSAPESIEKEFHGAKKKKLERKFCIKKFPDI